jgi:predicted phosphodiesterase
MKIAFISDIHSNLEALTAVSKSLQNQGPDIVLFLGDIVGYGADPNECIEMVRDIADDILAGNHDWAAVGKSSTDNFNPTAKKALEWTQSRLTKDSNNFLSSLSLKGKMENFIYIHSTPFRPEEWNYIFSLSDAVQSFDNFSQSLCFVAHSHIPVTFVQTAGGDTAFVQNPQFKLRKGFRYIINSGSVGQPRDGNPLSSYGIYDTKKKEYMLIRVQYDIEHARRKIIDAGLPESLANRLIVGK